MTRLLALLASAWLCACKSAPCPDMTMTLQVLAASAEVINPDEDQKTWALNLRIYELKSGAKLEMLDFETVFEQREAAFGEDFIKVHERSVFHDRREQWALELSPETSHVVTVGLFRKPIADAWYQVFAVPLDHRERICKERQKPERKREEIPDPCLYLAIEDYELRGGRFPPSGLDPSAFETACAPVARTYTGKKKKKKKKKKKPAWRPGMPTPSSAKGGSPTPASSPAPASSPSPAPTSPGPQAPPPKTPSRP